MHRASRWLVFGPVYKADEEVRDSVISGCPVFIKRQSIFNGLKWIEKFEFLYSVLSKT